MNSISTAEESEVIMTPTVVESIKLNPKFPDDDEKIYISQESSSINFSAVKYRIISERNDK